MFSEIRCPKCNKLIEKADARGLLEIVCPRCREKNVLILPTALFYPTATVEKIKPIIW